MRLVVLIFDPQLKRLKCPRDVPDKPGSLPQVGIDHAALQVHRHRRSRVPEHPLNHIRVGASGQPHRRCCMTQIMNAEAGGHLQLTSPRSSPPARGAELGPGMRGWQTVVRAATVTP